jgi:hypothetical protein
MRRAVSGTAPTTPPELQLQWLHVHYDLDMYVHGKHRVTPSYAVIASVQCGDTLPSTVAAQKTPVKKYAVQPYNAAQLSLGE